MSKMAHTPGPWGASFTDCRGGPARYCRIRPVSGEMFGHFQSLEIATMYMMDEAEQQANARLIAAAPELLDALQGLVKELSDSDDEGLIENAEPMIAARVAIDKALGEAQ